MHDSYFRRLWNNESGCLDIYEEGFEEAYEALIGKEWKNTKTYIAIRIFRPKQTQRKRNSIFYVGLSSYEVEKLYWLRREKDLTETIIKIISEEKVLDIREEMEKKMIQDNGGQNDET